MNHNIPNVDHIIVIINYKYEEIYILYYIINSQRSLSITIMKLNNLSKLLNMDNIYILL